MFQWSIADFQLELPPLVAPAMRLLRLPIARLLCFPIEPVLFTFVQSKIGFLFVERIMIDLFGGTLIYIFYKRNSVFSAQTRTLGLTGPAHLMRPRVYCLILN